MGPWLIEAGEPQELAPWLAGGPPDRAASAVMLVRGDGPVARVFLPNALDAAKEDERRVVVWLRHPSVYEEGRVDALFRPGGPSCLAVVLDRDGNTAAWVARDRIEVEDAAFAFAEAEKTKVEVSDA